MTSHQSSARPPTRWRWISRCVSPWWSPPAVWWRVYRPVLERMGLTHPQYLVMLALWQYAPLSVKRLSTLLQLDPGTLSPLLKRLGSGGLLTRRRDRGDERLLSVELTAAGAALRDQALEVPPAIVARLGMSVGTARTCTRR